MCGIFGICYGDHREEWTPTELAQLLFPAIVHRGPHAFGWMTWDGSSDIKIVKHPGDVGRVKNLKQVDVDDGAKWLVGHVRYATHGDVENLANDHPVRHGDVVGVHNGVLHDYDEILGETGREDESAEVDSEAIFAAVDRWGHRAGLRRIKGNMAAVYAKFSKPSDVFFAKSAGRPLVFARTKAGNLVFASELKVLQSVWGNELTDVREIKRNQLVRVVDGRVKKVEQYQPTSPTPRSLAPDWKPRGRRLPQRTTRRVQPGWEDRMRDRIDGGDRSKPEAAAPRQQQLTKKQRKRARQAARARAEAAVAAARERYESDESMNPTGEDVEGFYWWGGMCVTPDEYALLKADEGEKS